MFNVDRHLSKLLKVFPKTTISYRTKPSSNGTLDPATGKIIGNDKVGTFEVVLGSDVSNAKASTGGNADSSLKFYAESSSLPDDATFASSTLFTICGVEWSYQSEANNPSGSLVTFTVGRV